MIVLNPTNHLYVFWKDVIPELSFVIVLCQKGIADSLKRFIELKRLHTHCESCEIGSSSHCTKASNFLLCRHHHCFFGHLGFFDISLCSCPSANLLPSIFVGNILESLLAFANTCSKLSNSQILAFQNLVQTLTSSLRQLLKFFLWSWWSTVKASCQWYRNMSLLWLTDDSWPSPPSQIKNKSAGNWTIQSLDDLFLVDIRILRKRAAEL